MNEGWDSLLEYSATMILIGIIEKTKALYPGEKACDNVCPAHLPCLSNFYFLISIVIKCLNLGMDNPPEPSHFIRVS